MPDVDNVTVVSTSTFPVSVAVRVSEPPLFSAIELDDVDKETVGADSFSVMVMVSD